MGINKIVKQYITENGIKQSYISEKTGIPIDTISKIMLEKRKMTAEEFLLICDAISLDPRQVKEKLSA